MFLRIKVVTTLTPFWCGEPSQGNSAPFFWRYRQEMREERPANFISRPGNAGAARRFRFPTGKRRSGPPFSFPDPETPERPAIFVSRSGNAGAARHFRFPTGKRRSGPPFSFPGRKTPERPAIFVSRSENAGAARHFRFPTGNFGKRPHFSFPFQPPSLVSHGNCGKAAGFIYFTSRSG